MRNKKLYTVYSVEHIPGIWELAEKQYPSKNLIGVEYCPNRQMDNYTIWLGDINEFLRGKNYKKYKIKISNNLSNDIANIYKDLTRRGFKIDTVVENSESSSYLNVYYFI